MKQMGLSGALPLGEASILVMYLALLMVDG